VTPQNIIIIEYAELRLSSLEAVYGT